MTEVSIGAYGKSSQERKATCDPRLQKILDELIKLMDHTIICGHRGQIDQDMAYAKKLSKTPWPLSKHNSVPSLAADVAPFYGVTPNLRWPSAEIMRNADAQVFARYAYMIGLARGIASQMGINLRSGMDWDSDGEIADNTFNDLPHLELTDG